MKEIIEQSIAIIQEHAAHFEITEKSVTYKDETLDFFTTADTLSQEMGVKLMKENFPTFGIIAEEDDLTIPSQTGDDNLRFAFDGLDGTKAYMRRQSHGIGVMLALARKDEIIAAFVGDVNSDDIYGYQSNIDKVRRVFKQKRCSVLEIDECVPLKKQYGLLRDTKLLPHPIIQGITKRPEQGGLVKDFEIISGSIGTYLARLWKSEVGLAIVENIRAPWDAWAPIGISKKLGFVFFGIRKDNGEAELFDPQIVDEVVLETPYSFIIIVHKSRREELTEWLATQGVSCKN